MSWKVTKVGDITFIYQNIEAKTPLEMCISMVQSFNKEFTYINVVRQTIYNFRNRRKPNIHKRLLVLLDLFMEKYWKLKPLIQRDYIIGLVWHMVQIDMLIEMFKDVTPRKYLEARYKSINMEPYAYIHEGDLFTYLTVSIFYGHLKHIGEKVKTYTHIQNVDFNMRQVDHGRDELLLQSMTYLYIVNGYASL